MAKKIHIDNDNNWATPPLFYNELNKEFKFNFDPCPYYEGIITPDKDGLLKEWGKRNFINPPYSQKLKELFITKAFEESKKGKLCVMLLPVSTGTKIFHSIIYPYAKEIRFIEGRLRFGKRDKKGVFYLPKDKNGKIKSGTKDSMIVVFK